MVNQFGCRPVMLIGGLLASSGMILASFTTNIIELYLTAGVLTGESPRSREADTDLPGKEPRPCRISSPFSIAISSTRSLYLFTPAHRRLLVLNIAPVGDASAGSKQAGPGVEGRGTEET